MHGLFHVPTMADDHLGSPCSISRPVHTSFYLCFFSEGRYVQFKEIVLAFLRLNITHCDKNNRHQILHSAGHYMVLTGKAAHFKNRKQKRRFPEKSM